MYAIQGACNDSGLGGIDDCEDNRCDIVTEVFQKVQNIGESYASLNRYIGGSFPKGGLAIDFRAAR